MKELSEFLKKHRVLTKFKKNLRKYCDFTNDIKYLCTIGHKDTHISGAFNWYKTEEGINFQGNLNDKWKASL